MSNIIDYLKQQYDDHDDVYKCLCDTLKAFDTGLLLMFLYSNEDIMHSQEHGELPEGAEPLDVSLRHSDVASHTGGVFAEPWYIAQQLRKVAAKLELIGVEKYEACLRGERMQAYGVNVTEESRQQLPVYRERMDSLRKLLDEVVPFYTDGNQPGVDVMGSLLSRAMDIGIQIQTVEDSKSIADEFRKMGQSIIDEKSQLAARIARIEASSTSEDDPDGFSQKSDPDSEEEKPLFS